MLNCYFYKFSLHDFDLFVVAQESNPNEYFFEACIIVKPIHFTICSESKKIYIVVEFCSILCTCKPVQDSYEQLKNIKCNYCNKLKHRTNSISLKI